MLPYFWLCPNANEEIIFGSVQSPLPSHAPDITRCFGFEKERRKIRFNLIGLKMTARHCGALVHVQIYEFSLNFGEDSAHNPLATVTTGLSQIIIRVRFGMKFVCKPAADTAKSTRRTVGGSSLRSAANIWTLLLKYKHVEFLRCTDGPRVSIWG